MLMDLVHSLPDRLPLTQTTAVPYPAVGLPAVEGHLHTACSLWLSSVLCVVATVRQKDVADHLADRCYPVCEIWFCRRVADARQAWQCQDWKQELLHLSSFFRMFGNRPASLLQDQAVFSAPIAQIPQNITAWREPCQQTDGVVTQHAALSHCLHTAPCLCSQCDSVLPA